MARFAGENFAAGSVGWASGCLAEVDAATRPERAVARNRSSRGLGQDRRRFHCHAFITSRLAGRRSLCARASTRLALRAGAGLEDRHPEKTKAALWRENHS